ncbi:MAG: AI-2E family transporter [Ruminococcaceae bacterium]|nr:AI-2E family transporter [Oscillospiraceae bacterium]
MEFNKKTLRNIFLGLAGCIVLYWILHETERVTSLLNVVYGIIKPFVAGAALAFVLNVPMRAFERLLKKIKNNTLRRVLSLLLTFVSILLVLYGIIYLLIPQISETVESIIATLPGFFNRVQQSVVIYLNEHPEIMEWLSEYTNFATFDWSGLIQKAISIITDGLGGVVDTAISTIVNLGTGIFNGVLAIVFAIYCLGKKEVLARQGRRLLYSFLPEKVCDETIRILRMTNTTFSNFISGQCLEAVILGLMFALFMTIFGMPYMPLVSVIITVTALVPIVGAFVGCILGGFFILVVDPALAFWFVVMFLILQQIEGNLIYPRVVGTSIGLPGMWVLVAVAVGGDLMGPVGMLLMIPLASVLYALMREFTQKRIAQREIPAEKLQDQPPENLSGDKEKGGKKNSFWSKFKRKKKKG